MNVRVPTTDEVDTGFTTFAWELEKSSPGEYGEGSGYENYHTVCEGFRAWLAEVRREAAEKALTDLARKIEATSKRTDNTFTEHAVVEAGGLELLREAAEAYRQEREER